MGTPFTFPGKLTDAERLLRAPNGSSTFNAGLNIAGPGALTAGGASTFNANVNITYPADLNFGSSLNQMINLCNTNYGIGVQASDMYFRSDSEFFRYQHGSHSDTFASSDGGSTLMRLGNQGDLIVTGNVNAGRHECGLLQCFQRSKPERELQSGGCAVAIHNDIGTIVICQAQR